MRMGPGRAPKATAPKLRAALKGRASGLTASKLTHRAARRSTPFEETLAAVRNEVPKAARAAVYVAVIVRRGFADGGLWRLDSGRYDDGWFALMGEDKDKLVTEALAKARGFERAAEQKYEVAIGVLDEMIVIPTIYEVVKLQLDADERRAEAEWVRASKRKPKRPKWPGMDRCDAPKTGRGSCAESGHPHRHCECGLAIELDHGYCDTCMAALIRGAAMNQRESDAMLAYREAWLLKYKFIRMDAQGVHVVYE